MFFTRLVVCTMVVCSWTSALSRCFRLTSTCCRMASILKLRSSGCVTFSDTLDCS
jgi:hypothetical protein